MNKSQDFKRQTDFKNAIIAYRLWLQASHLAAQEPYCAEHTSSYRLVRKVDPPKCLQSTQQPGYTIQTLLSRRALRNSRPCVQCVS